MKKGETVQKYEETDLKFEETNQQIENFKVFEKSRNGSKVWGNGPDAEKLAIAENFKWFCMCWF